MNNEISDSSQIANVFHDPGQNTFSISTRQYAIDEIVSKPLAVDEKNKLANTTWQPRVHILEQDKAVADAISILCRTHGLMPVSYISVDELLARQLTRPPGCIVAEVRSYKPGPLQLMQRINDAGVTLPTIFLTTDSDVATAVSAIRAGVFDFLEKPYVSKVLMHRIQNAVSYSTSE